MLQLQPNVCDSLGVAAHELGHAIGMTHEHSMPDLDNYVTVLSGNIKPGKENNFEIEAGGDTAIPYDPRSLMHYGGNFFGLPGPDGRPMATITRNDGQAGTGTMGNRMGLTRADADQVARMYGCHGSQADFKLCSSREDECISEECICHQLPAGEAPMIKVEKNSGCFQCVKECMTPEPGAPGCSPGFCGCPQGLTKQTLDASGGGVCHKCIDPNLPGPPCPSGDGACTGNEACSCSAPLEKKTLSMSGGGTCFACRGGSSGGGGGAAQQCPSGGSCTENEKCVCPSGSGLSKKTLSMMGGGVCYACQSPPICPSLPSCSTDKSCGCTDGLEKKAFNGGTCFACESPPAPPTPTSRSQRGNVADSPPCENDGSWTDSFGENCADWQGYRCSVVINGKENSAKTDELKRKCPVVCNTCPTSPTPRPTPAPPTPRPTRPAPTPKPTPKPTSSESWVDAHNMYRCMHDAPPLEWNDDIAYMAQSWAFVTGNINKGRSGEHSKSKYRTNNAGFDYLGENIAWASNGPPSPAEAVKMWYDEVELTDGGKGALDDSKPGTGHYSQVVWKETTHVGCGEFDGTVLCIYGPGGNFNNPAGTAYQTQVSAKVKSEAQCTGTAR